MGLLQIALLAQLAALVAGGLGLARVLVREIAEQLGGEIDQLVMLDLAGRGQDHPARPVIAPHVVDQRGARHRRHGLGRPQDRAAERLAGIGGLLEQVEHQVVRRVLDHADLLQDDLALALQLVRLEGRVLQDVGQKIDRKRQILGQHADVIGGLLARGVGVQLAADILDLLGDRARRAALGALERHVLEHVGDAVDLGPLVARADIDPDPDARGLERGHRLARDPQAVAQGRDPGGVVAHQSGSKLLLRQGPEHRYGPRGPPCHWAASDSARAGS